MIASVALLLRRDNKGNDKFRFIPWQEMRWEYADYRITLAVELDAPARNISFASETSLPKPLGQDHHVVLARLIFVRCECAAEQKPGTEDLQTVCGHRNPTDALRFAQAGEVHIR